MRMSTAEAVFVVQADQSPVVRHYVREYRFAPRRRWRFDFAWPDGPIHDRWAVEVEGGTWVNGRHGRGKGFEADCEKYARAALLGWRVIRVTPAQIRSGAALAWIERAVKR